MTRIREAAAQQPHRVLLLVFSVLLLFGMLAAVAHAPNAHADERRGDDRRGADHRGYRGGPGWDHYPPPPPVAYGGPYYPPPPVVYGPGVGINFPGVSINLR